MIHARAIANYQRLAEISRTRAEYCRQMGWPYLAMHHEGRARTYAQLAADLRAAQEKVTDR